MPEKELEQIAARKIIEIFGKEYLRKTYAGSCKAQGMIGENTFMLFIGIKGSRDLPERKANDHGWVVYGKVLVDATSGKITEVDYVLE